MEVAIGICLTIMGIYFFKSTDLPKELIERSEQMRAETGPIQVAKVKRSYIPKSMDKKTEKEIDQNKLSDLNLKKKAAELKLHNDAIDKLTLTITTLEQEIKVNNAKNAEIQKQIDLHLVSLQILQEKVVRLS